MRDSCGKMNRKVEVGLLNLQAIVSRLLLYLPSCFIHNMSKMQANNSSHLFGHERT